jgi:thioredoxin-dependent peroxiredoxin
VALSSIWIRHNEKSMAAKKSQKATAGGRISKPTKPSAPSKVGKKVKASSRVAAATLPAKKKSSGPGAAKKTLAGAARALAPTSAAKSQASAKTQVPAQAAAGNQTGPSEGDRAPSFQLQDQSGALLSSKDLASHPYVLYFYPKNDTPGCTVEACAFRDASEEFTAAGVRVIGVSPDSTASHQKFRTKYALPFTLLSDPDQRLANAYGVWALKKNYGREYMGIVRSTFLVGPDGVIRAAWRGVRVKDHIQAVQTAAEKLS